jgi:hypothetical protein
VRQAVRSVELFQKHYRRHLQETGKAVPGAVAGQVDATGSRRLSERRWARRGP